MNLSVTNQIAPFVAKFRLGRVFLWLALLTAAHRMYSDSLVCFTIPKPSSSHDPLHPAVVNQLPQGDHIGNEATS